MLPIPLQHDGSCKCLIHTRFLVRVQVGVPMRPSSNGLGNLPFKQGDTGSSPVGRTILVRCDRSHTRLLPVEIVGSSPTARANTVLPQWQREQVESLSSPGSSPGSSTNTSVAQWISAKRYERLGWGFESSHWCQYDSTPIGRGNTFRPCVV